MTTQEHAVDTLHQATGAAAHAGDAHGAEEGVDIVHHLADARTMEFPPFGEIHLPEIHLFGLDLSITKYATRSCTQTSAAKKAAPTCPSSPPCSSSSCS
jgi:hypothetical protein